MGRKEGVVGVPSAELTGVPGAVGVPSAALAGGGAGLKRRKYGLVGVAAGGAGFKGRKYGVVGVPVVPWGGGPAGAPVVMSKGRPAGTLCLWLRRPKDMTMHF